MVTDKLYCIDLLDELQDCWFIYDIIHSLNSNVKVGTHIFHNLTTCKCSIILSCLVYLRFKCVVKIFCWSENFLLFKHIPVICKFYCKENISFTSVVNFTSKISISSLLNQAAQFSTDQRLAVELCVKSRKSMTVHKRLKKTTMNKN